MDATTVAIDLAKDVFQVAMTSGDGHVISRRRLTRRQFSAFVETLQPGVTVLMETCGTAHYWGRRCRARGARVRLLPAQYVRPYVRRDKTDRADAEALLEAHRCDAIHEVPLKTVDQQVLVGLHRVRQQWQTTRTARINLLRGLLREHGVVFPVGATIFLRQISALVMDASSGLPPLLCTTTALVLDEIRAVADRITAIDRQLAQIARRSPGAQRLQQIPGVGVITSTALIGWVPHIHSFHRGRQFASWLGLTPRESSSGSRRTLGHISKRGNTYLRALLVHGARSALRVAELRVRQGPASRLQQWAADTVQRRGRRRGAVALANKLARIIWAVWVRDVDFASPMLAA